MYDVLVGVSLNLKIFSEKYPTVFNDLSDNEVLNLRNQIRNEYNTIIVGANTVKIDNPNLLNKNNTNIRIVIDSYADLNLNSNVFINKPEKTYMILLKNNQDYIDKLRASGVNVVLVQNRKEMFEKIKEISIGKILIEGGAKTIEMFLEENLINNIKMVRFPIVLPTDSLDLFRNSMPINLKLQDNTIINNKYTYEIFKVLK